jgi:hypothetical protein
MKKTVVLVLASMLLVSGLVAPVSAAKKKKKAKPVATKLFLHGDSAVGENDSFSAVAEAYLPMDSTEPSGSEMKSRQITDYLVGPNTQCAGNNLFPVWSGELTGRVKGDVKLTFSTIGTLGEVVVRMWPDVTSSLCDSETTGATDYVDPAGEVVVELPPGSGTVEAVMEGVNFKALGTVIVQISPPVAVDLPSPAGSILTPLFSRVLYDSTEFASVLEFDCIPAKGKSCTP